MHTSKNRQNKGKVTTHKKVAAKTKTKKSTRSSKSKGNALKSFFGFLSSERMIQVYGVLFMLFSLLLLISTISYLFTHTADSKFISSSAGENVPGNIGGALGAYIAYFFVDYFFGLYSAGFALLFFIIGLRLTFAKEPLPIFKNSITTDRKSVV